MSPFSRRQVAARRLLLDGRGDLNADARVVAFHLKRLCWEGQSAIVYGPGGHVDPVATAVRAAKREVWQQMTKLVLLDAYTDANLTED